MKRDLRTLCAESFDVLVVGGGIAGACTARDAALRGLRTALVDAGDFGSGTSANSLKILHGGLRYLQHLELGRMREAIRERSTWLRIAPHLTEPLPVVLPTSVGARTKTALWRAALAMNDLAGWDRNRDVLPEHRLPAGRRIGRAECLALAPQLESTECHGGVLFHDALMYSPERLVLEVVKAAAGAGAVVANHVACEGPVAADREAYVLALEDRLTGDRLEVRARLVVNAAGPAILEIARRFGVRAPAPFQQSVALNLVLPDLGHRAAFAIGAATGASDAFRSGERRHLFVVPWRGRTLIGTAHYALDPAFPRHDAEAYAERFLAEVNRAWPDGRLDASDIVAVHSGFLPQATRRQRGGMGILRNDLIVDHEAEGAAGLVSVVAVKFTTARGLAEKVVDRLLRKLGRSPLAARTARTPLPGGGAAPAALLREARKKYGASLAADVLEHLVRAHGTDFERVVECGLRLPEWNARVVPDRPVIRAQLAYAAAEEMGVTSEDLVRRRTELGAVGSDHDDAWRTAADILRSGSGTVIA